MDRVGFRTRTSPRSWVLAVLAVVAGLGALVAPSAASAADDSKFNCDALALRAQLLALAPLVLGTANAGAPDCQNADGTLISIPASAGLPLTAGVLVAKTSVSADLRTAGSIGAVTGLGVGLGGSVLGQITGPISQAVTGSAGPIPLGSQLAPALLATLGLGPSTVTITRGDLAGGLQQILNSVLSNVLNGSIAGIGVAGATAGATCVNNQPLLKGSSSITGLSILGQDVPLDAVTNQVLNLLNTAQLQNLTLKNLVDQLVANLLTTLGLNGSLKPVQDLVAAVTTILDTTAQPLLTSILAAVQPLINSIIRITVEPNTQVIANGQLTQTALHVNVTLLNQPLLDVVAGRARVSATSISCQPPTVEPSRCGTRKLALLDVFQQGNHTFIAGAAADKKFFGKTIPIYFDLTGKLVATAKVDKNGLFQTTAPLPPIGIRFTNKARYYAKAQGETSLRLKFFRRMHVTTLTSSGGKVQISGFISLPLTKPVAKVIIQRRISCTKTINVLTLNGTAGGRFAATLDAPPSGQVGVYRAVSFVRQNPRSRKDFPTAALPRFVNIP